MANPLDERTVGNAPYEEALAKAQARNLRGGGIHLSNIIERLGQRQRLIAALAGLGSFRQDQPLGANILNVLGGVGKARLALDQQAQLEQYRTQQQANEERRAARLEQAKPEKPERDTRPWYYQEKYWDHPGAEALRKKAEYVKPPAGAKAPKPPKPVGEVKLPTEIRTGIRIIRMMDPNNPEHVARLRSLILNPPSEEERRAAETKLNQATRITPHPGLP